jgi:glucose uptake protein GlcU
MERNVGPEDRVVRIVVGIGLLALLYFVPMSQMAQIIVGVLAAVLILTGLVARCMLYKILGVDTTVQEQSYSTTDDRSF